MTASVHGGDLYLCPVCDAVIETALGADPECPAGPHICGDARPWQGRLYVCDLPDGHADNVHQESGGITWALDGRIL